MFKCGPVWLLFFFCALQSGNQYVFGQGIKTKYPWLIMGKGNGQIKYGDKQSQPNEVPVKMHYIVQKNKVVTDRSAYRILRHMDEEIIVIETDNKTLFTQLSDIGEEIYRANQLWKLSPRLVELIEYEITTKVTLPLLVQYADRQSLVNELLPHLEDAEIKGEYESANLMLISSHKGINLNRLLEHEEIIFIDVSSPRISEELLIERLDRGAGNLSKVNIDFPEIDGGGIHISIKELNFDDQDIDFKGRIVESGLSSELNSTHAAIMATIAAGAGNTSPQSRGVARGSLVSSSDFANLLPDPTENYRFQEISVQNHSYGVEGTENYYGLDAVAYDQSVNETPWLVHVFSSGNQGELINEGGPFAGIKGFGTLSGSFKMSKNAMVIGSMDREDQVPTMSSKGPAYDGRIKPELVAPGEAGSSSAAAYVSGVIAMIQQLYKNLNHDTLPDAALVKAVLISAADNVGNEGPDYASGFGRINAVKSLEIIDLQKFITSTITVREEKSFTIEVPERARDLRICLSWQEAPPEAFAPQSVLNDLDVICRTPEGNMVRPWTLDNRPSPEFLSLPARRGRDKENNVELISIDQPESGQYQVMVSTGAMQDAMQKFHIAYDYDIKDTVVWSFPVQGDHLLKGFEETLRWRSDDDTYASLDYSSDEGKTWTALADSVQLSVQKFTWTPETELEKVIFRLQTENKTFYSSTAISHQPLEIQVGFNCGDSILIYWNNLPGVSSYQLYQLGEKYMSPVMNIIDTMAVIKRDVGERLFYAVGPVLDGFGPVDHGITKDLLRQGAGCYIDQFFAVLRGQSVELQLELGTLFQVEQILFEKIDGDHIKEIEKFSGSIAASHSSADPSPSVGINRYRVRIKLKNGQEIISGVREVYYTAELPYLVFPNPIRSGDRLRIISKDSSLPTFSLYDIHGRPIFSFLLDDFLTQYQLGAVTPGIYFYQIHGDDATEQAGTILVTN